MKILYISWLFAKKQINGKESREVIFNEIFKEIILKKTKDLDYITFPTHNNKLIKIINNIFIENIKKSSADRLRGYFTLEEKKLKNCSNITIKENFYKK